MMLNGTPVDAISARPREVESPSDDNPFPFLDLSREIRDQILGEVLFPGEKEARFPGLLGTRNDSMYIRCLSFPFCNTV